MSANGQVSPSVWRLTHPELEEVRLTFCRPRKRELYFQFMPSALAAVGVMLESVRNHRNEVIKRRGGPEVLLERVHLEHFCEHQRGWNGDAKSKLKQLFAGWPPSDSIGRFAPDLLRFVLLGLPDETVIPDDLPSEVVKEADRIVRAFFANCPYVESPDEVGPRDTHDVRPEGAWYFWPFAKKQGRSLHVRHTFSSAEALVEMEWLRREIAQGHAKDARMTRVFSELPFRMVDMSKHSGTTRPRLTSAGEETMRCLRAGIDQVFVFPAQRVFSSDPEDSAKAFQAWAQERRLADSWSSDAGRVYLVPVECTATAQSDVVNRKRYGWEHLVPHQNVIYYQWEATGSQSGEEERLSYLRHPRHGPCAFEPDDAERSEFGDWFRLFVVPQLRTTEPPLASNVGSSIEGKSNKRRPARKRTGQG